MRAVLAALVVGTAVCATPASAQRADEAAGVRVSGFAAVSFREGLDGVRVARDVLTASARVELPRLLPRLWAQADLFERPQLDCSPEITCNREGLALFVGGTLPLSLDDTRRGVHPYGLGAAGVGFSAETTLAYIVGFGAAIVPTDRVAFSAEARFETLPGIRNILMANLGVRLDLF